MKNFKTTKKLLSLVLCVLMVFSTVSVAAAETQVDKTANCAKGEHVFGGYVGESVAATCETDGLETYKCSVCKDTFQVITPKTGHNYDEEAWVTIVEAQHTSASVIQGRRRNYCLDCNEMQLEYINIPHEFAEGDSGEITRRATCVSDGATLKKCILCEKKQTVIVPKNDNAHVYSEVYFTSTVPTCEKPGSGVKVCKHCDKVVTVTDVYAKNADEAHSYLPWILVTPLPDGAVCSDQNYGMLVKDCPDCDYNDEQKFYAKHDITNPVGVVATCTDFGYAKGFCNNCATSNATNVLLVDSSKHVWMKDIVLEEATCQNDGRILRRCELNRAHAEIVVVKDGDHKFAGDWIVTKEATCDEAGTKENTCTVCGRLFTEEIPVDESLHIFDEDNSTKEFDHTLDCKVVVKEKSSCTECGKYMERDILNHDFEKKGTVNPTCSATGKIFYKCTKCSTDKIVTIPADSKLHVGSGYYYVVTQPTCNTEGIKAELCKKCNKAIITDETIKKVPMKGHAASEWDTTVQSTCTEAGTKDRHCTNEGCTFNITMNIAPSHTYTSWSYSQPGKDSATCKVPVSRTRKCLVDGCNKIETEPYYGGHTPVSHTFVGNGNCVDGGRLMVKCGVCNNNYKSYDIPAGVHVLDTENPVKAIDRDNSICGGMIYNCLVCEVENPDKPGEKMPLQVRLTNLHTFRSVDTEIEPFDPTCELPGLTGKKHCIDCFYVLEQTIIPPTEHNFVWGAQGEIYCSKCGEFKVGENEGTDEEPEITTCKHFCHNNGTMAKILLKILTIFWKLFGINQECDCGAVHYETKK